MDDFFFAALLPFRFSTLPRPPAFLAAGFTPESTSIAASRSTQGYPGTNLTVSLTLFLFCYCDILGVSLGRSFLSAVSSPPRNGRETPIEPKDIPSLAISTSLCGFGWAASSSSFAERRSARAASTGPKTCFLSLWLFDLTALDLALFAIFEVSVGELEMCGLILPKLKKVGRTRKSRLKSYGERING